MKRLIPIIALLYHRRNNILLTVLACLFSLSPMYSKIKDDREYHIDFHRTMASIRRPSTLSSLTNYRWHTNGYRKKPFILDGDLNLPIVIKGPSFCNLLNTFHVVPRFQFRIFANDDQFPYQKGDTSNPVRTPSAMPGFAWYMTSTSKWDNIHSAVQEDLRHHFYWGIYAYHHSNGQDGQELDTTSNGVIRVNLYNGNFGEQFVFEPTIGGRFKFGFDNSECMNSPKEDPAVVRKRTAETKVFYWQLSYEWRPDTWTNSTFDEYDIYGKNRIRMMFNLMQIRTVQEMIFGNHDFVGVSRESFYERFRYNLNLSYIADANYKSGDISALKEVGLFDFSKRLNVDLTIHFIPNWSKNMGWFSTIGYVGSDEYNVYFQDSYLHYKMGLSFAFFDQPDWQEIDLTDLGLPNY